MFKCLIVFIVTHELEFPIIYGIKMPWPIDIFIAFQKLKGKKKNQKKSLNMVHA